MELRHLEHFLAVVDTGSFSAAAARLFLVQSSLSASILSLERELGTELFIRGRRGAEVTDAGQALVGPARATLAEADRSKDAVAAVRGLMRGHVRIGTVAVPRSVDVLDTVAAFRKSHPGVEVHVLHDGARDLVGWVVEGKVDFAITPQTTRATPAVTFQPLLTTPVVVLCSADHRLAGRREVNPQELLSDRIIDLPSGWWARELFDGLLSAKGLTRHVEVEVNEWFGVLTMVRRGMGISYGPLACIDRDAFGDIAWATIADAPVWQLGIVKRDNTLRGAAGQAFLAAYLRRCHETLSAQTGVPPSPT